MQEDGWVVCRAFKKKSIQRSFDQPDMVAAADDDELQSQFHGANGMTAVDQKCGLHQLMHGGGFPTFDPSMHLPQLTSAETPPGVLAFMSGTPTAPVSMNSLDVVGCSQNMMKLTTSGGRTGEMLLNAGDRFGTAADWSILDKLLASHQNLDQLFHSKVGASAVGVHQQQQQQLTELGASSLQRLPFHYLGCEAADLLKFSK